MLNLNQVGDSSRGLIQLTRALEPGEALPRVPSLCEQLAACGMDLDRIWLEERVSEIEVSELEFREVRLDSGRIWL